MMLNLSFDELDQLSYTELQITPALAPPGITSNLVDPPSRANVLITVASVLFGLMIVFYLSRVYTKLLVVGKVTLDDGEFQSNYDIGTNLVEAY